MSLRLNCVALAALASAAICGCAQPLVPRTAPPHLVPQGCLPGSPPGICKLTVTVNNCASGDIKVNPELVVISNAVVMQWEIVTDGFVFAANGIDFQPPNAQFVVAPLPPSRRFQVRNAKSQAGDFYYFVNVQGCATADPWARNN
jgi:hypothetical protein